MSSVAKNQGVTMIKRMMIATFGSHFFIFAAILIVFLAKSSQGDLCDPNPCADGGTCTEVVLLEGDDVHCSCVGGSRGKDRFCNPKLGHTKKPLSRCASHPCKDYETCIPDPYFSWSSEGFVCA